MFQSAAYIAVFLVCVIVLAKVSSWKVRQTLLLTASSVLYLTWVRWFAAVLFFSVTINFLIGRELRRKPTALPLWAGITFNLLLLGLFKYLPEEAAHLPFSSLQQFSHLALPLGISFWTFQALSYLFDLYRGEELDPTFPEFALYMAFFPVTISGPVCRLPDMLPQFRSQTTTSWNSIMDGFRRIAMGALMMELAKLLGMGILAGDGIVSGFDRTRNWTGADVWCLAFGYGLQLFFDFAGYSHIAIGAAQALGFVVPENFQRPFASTSPSTFWTRWHMSLSFWIRDYIFFPLATLRREICWRNLALILAMALFGLWHKASLLFLIWGVYHGVLLVLHRQIQQIQRKLDWAPPVALWNTLSWLVTVGLVSLAWIFFRANSLSQAGQMLSAIVSPSTYGSHVLSSSLYFLVAALAAGYAAVRLVASMLRTTEQRAESDHAPSFLFRWRWFWILPLYALTMFFVLMITLGQNGSAAQLMYRGF